MSGKVNEVLWMNVHHGQKEQRVVRTQLAQTQPDKQASIDEATVHSCTTMQVKMVLAPKQVILC